jgi:hypothetical protein
MSRKSVQRFCDNDMRKIKDLKRRRHEIVGGACTDDGTPYITAILERP